MKVKWGHMFILEDIFELHESPEKMDLFLDPISKDVTILIHDLNEEWFKELEEVLS